MACSIGANLRGLIEEFMNEAFLRNLAMVAAEPAFGSLAGVHLTPDLDEVLSCDSL